MMKHLFVASVIVLSLATGASAQSQVIQQLPKDGGWVTFFGEMKSVNAGDFELSGTVTLRSVGIAMEDGKKCRWIEAEMKGTLKDGNKLTIIAKILVEEAGFGPKVKTAPTIVRGWRKIQGGEIEELKDDQVSYKSDLGVLMIGWSKTAKTVKNVKTINYQKGQLKIENAVNGSPEFKPANASTETFQLKQSLWLSEKIPFGIAAREIEVEVRDNGKVASKFKMEFTLQDYGTGASSIWPDKK